MGGVERSFSETDASVETIAPYPLKQVPSTRLAMARFVLFVSSATNPSACNAIGLPKKGIVVE